LTPCGHSPTRPRRQARSIHLNPFGKVALSLAATLPSTIPGLPYYWASGYKCAEPPEPLEPRHIRPPSLNVISLQRGRRPPDRQGFTRYYRRLSPAPVLPRSAPSLALPHLTTIQSCFRGPCIHKSNLGSSHPPPSAFGLLRLA
jgi:hypothetical protein